MHVIKGQLTSCDNRILPSTCFRINIGLTLVTSLTVTIDIVGSFPMDFKVYPPSLAVFIAIICWLFVKDWPMHLIHWEKIIVILQTTFFNSFPWIKIYQYIYQILSERWNYAIIALCLQIFNYYDVIMGAIASQITSLTIVCSTVYSDADQRKHRSSASLAFVRGIYRGPVNSPHKWPITRKMFPFDDVTMWSKLFRLKRNGWRWNYHRWS